jgi:predicted nucleic acid-binding protein
VKRVFIDTGAFFAHLIADDIDNPHARRAFEQARLDSWLLITTNAVVFETYALLVNRARNGRAFAIAFLDALDLGFCEVVRVTREDEAAAIALVRAHEDKTYSLCDAMSFVVMERMNITDAIAFDRHFAEYGRFALI